MTAKPKALTRNDFKQLVGNIYYFYRFDKDAISYELCLEPCLNGFDVALYERFGTATNYHLALPKVCTNEQGYDKDLFGTAERSEATWEHALQQAEELLIRV